MRLALPNTWTVGATRQMKPSFGANERKSTESDWLPSLRNSIADLTDRVLEHGRRGRR